jgi:hypothetical protein
MKQLIKKNLFLFLLIFSPLFIPRFQTAQASNFEKVILLVWDGTQRNHLNELLAAGQLPNLQRLINEGEKRNLVIYTTNCLRSNDGDNYRTETNPTHAAMLTGYGYPTMKNYSNSVRGPIPIGYTIFERIKQSDSQIKTGMIFAHALYFFPFPAFENVAPTNCCYWYWPPNEDDPQKRRCGKRSASLPPMIDACQILEAENDAIRKRMINFLTNNASSSFFLFGYFKEPDNIGHDYGENSQAYSDAIIDNDTQLGLIIQKLKSLGIYEQTVILVDTDHGFNEGTDSHSTCNNDTKNLWIVSSKKAVIDGQVAVAKQTSIVPTILDIFGISKNVKPSFAGESLYDLQVITLSSGWNGVTWPNILSYTAKTALEGINSSCGKGTGLMAARKAKDFWQDYVAGFGGINFNLQNGRNYFINISEDCDWVP